MATATGSSTRCPRPDCTALREELELVRGDLLELEGESDQLHERVAALEGERSDQRTRHERELADKHEETQQLSALVQDLTAQLRAAAAASVPAAASAAPAASNTVLPSMAELERTYADLRGKNSALETQLADLRASVAKETAASSAATEQVVRIAQESKEKRGELYKALQENELLRGEVATLRSSLRSVSEKATAYETSIRGLHAQLDDYRSAVDEQTLEITQLHSKLQLVEREKNIVEAKLIEMDEKESDVEALTQQARAAFDLEKAPMQRELTRLRDEMKRLQEQQEQQLHDADEGRNNDQSIKRAPSGRARSASLDADDRDVREMAKQLELLQELRIRDKNTILELNQRILQQQSDLTSLTEHVDTINGDSAAVEQAVRAAVEKEAASHAATHAENSKLLRRLKEQSTLVRDLEARQGELERQLNDAQTWNARYERGAGLEDVMKFQKQMRKQQQANMKLRNELNEQIEAAGRLHASFERLKEETGRPSTFQYDDLVVAEHLQGQVAVHRAVMAQMEQQVQELESERVRLLQRLRNQARVAGSKLYEAHGLTMEQWEVVEEFMDQLKRTPEVAKRVLVADLQLSDARDSTSNACHSAQVGRDGKIESPRSGEDTDGWELVVKGDAENARLLSEVTRLREELEAAKIEAVSARTAAAAAAASSHEGDQPHVQTTRDHDEEVTSLRTSVRELQLQCDGLLEELEATKRALDAEKQASAATKAATGTAVTAESALNEPDAEKKAAPRAKRGASSRGTQTIDVPSSDNSATAKQQREENDLGSRNPPQTTRNYENSAECIAQTVVKALEAQLALFKQAATPHSAQPSTVTSAADVDSSSASGTTEENGSAPSTARAKTPRGKPIPAAAAVYVRPQQEEAAPDPMTIASDEDLAKQIDYLKELNVCLDELAQSEVREEALESQLREHEHAFQSLMDQHTVLYAHFFHMHAQYSAAESKLRREREQLEATNREWEIKCQRLEAGLHTVGGADPLDADMLPNEAQLRAQVAHLTQQMAAFEVNGARWKRTCRHLQEELRASAGRNAMLATEWLEMEKALKFRILYLESWKQGADDMMERMDKALGASVLKRVSDRQQHALVDVLCRYRDVSSAYADVRVKYLELYDLPVQLSKAQHRLELLEAERRARMSPGESGSGASKNVDKAEKKAGGGDKHGGSASRGFSADPILQERIAELELELQVQVNRVKELEKERANKFQELEAGDDQGESSKNWQQVLVITALNSGEPTDRVSGNDNALAAENTLLYERINEVEQLYDALTRECAKYKDVVALAASQANVLFKKMIHAQHEREDDAMRRRQLASASEDHALVGHLQLELMQLRTTYQQFALKHDVVVESQQRALLERQQLELAVERSAKELAEVRDVSRQKLLRLEATLTQVGTRDLTARNTKWDAFRKRLDALEDDLRAEHTRRKQLELELEDNMQQPSARSGGGGATAAMAEVSRLRSRVEELETRERALIAQLEATASSNNNARSPTREQMLTDELEDTKALNADLLRQVQAEQARVTELLTQIGALERDHRELRAQKEDIELELRQRLQQLECDGDDNQRQHARESGSPGSPVLMRKKVGLYEQDQAQLQQAAQATIASLKQLVEDKNELVREYQQKMAAIRAEVAQSKSQDRADASKLHKQLYDENQRVIAQLQDTTATIRQLERSGKDKRALQAAQERHEQVLRSWKQSEMALEEARQKICELQSALEVTTNERDLAEARAGEALEEIVTLQSNADERARHVEQLEQRVGAARGEMKKKDEKLQLLRDAIIKLKGEFLKAEDRHAVELARAQHALTATQLDSSRRKKKAEEREEQEDEWRDEKQRLEAQVKILQDKLALERSRSSNKEGNRQKQRQQREEGKEKEDGEGDAKKVRILEAEVKARAKEVEALAREVERLKTKVKEQAVNEARTVEELEKKLKVVQAQNAALREAAKPEGVTTADEGRQADQASLEERERLQAEADAATETARKLQRRVDMLTSRLKEQQQAAMTKEEELAAMRARVEQQQHELKRRQQREEKQSGATSDKRESDAAAKWRAQAADLQRQNAFLQETLVLKRSEWEDALRDQMARYEAQVARLRQRLSRRYGLHRDGSDSDGNDEGRSQLHREEARFLASQELRDELAALSEELRAREQQDMAKDTKLLELELEVETLRVECQRLQRLSSASKPAQQDASQSSASRGRAADSSRSALRSDFHERAALEQVIENMKKVIEKLRSENDKLRRAQGATNGNGGAHVTPEQFERLRRQLREHKDVRARLETQLEQLQRDLNDLKKQKLRLQQKLRAATTASLAASAADRRLQDKDAQLRATERALAEANATIAQRDEELQRLQDEMDQLQLEARSPVAGPRDQSRRIDELEEQITALEDENTRLTNELAAFDGEFFEEIEDLKYKYAEAVRDKRALERRLLHVHSSR